MYERTNPFFFLSCAGLCGGIRIGKAGPWEGKYVSVCLRPTRFELIIMGDNWSGVARERYGQAGVEERRKTRI